MHYDSSKLVTALQDTKGRSHQPWHSRIFGLVLFTAVAVACVLWIGINTIEKVFGFPIHWIVSLAGSAVSYKIWRWIQAARSVYALDATHLLKKDPRRPVIYLRSFRQDRYDRDQLESDPEPYISGGLIASDRPDRRHKTREQIIEPLLSKIGPFIAVGSPEDNFSPVGGAARIYLSDDEWEDKVKLLVEAASVVVIKPEPTNAIRLELTFISKNVDPRRLLMLVPNPKLRPAYYNQVRDLVSAQLGISLPTTDDSGNAFIFLGDQNPMLFTVEEEGHASLYRFVAQVNELNSGDTTPAIEYVKAKLSELACNITARAKSPSQWKIVPKTTSSVRLSPSQNIVDLMRKRVALYALGIGFTYFAVLVLAAAGPLIETAYRRPDVFQIIIFAMVIITPIAIWQHTKAVVIGSVDAALMRWNVDDIEHDINMDFSGRENICLHLCAATRWVCGVYKRDVLVHPLKEIVWVYPEQVGWKYQIVFWTRQGSAFAFRVPRRDVESSLARLSAGAPWINIGYTDDLKESWDTDAKEFIYLVEHRRTLMESQASSLK